MDFQTFFSTKLKLLHEQFRELTIKYHFNRLINRHLVELTPMSAYNDNAALDEAWFAIAEDFYNLFPGESVSFITDDSGIDFSASEIVYSSLLTHDDVNAVIANGLIWIAATKLIASFPTKHKVLHTSTYLDSAIKTTTSHDVITGHEVARLANNTIVTVMPNYNASIWQHFTEIEPAKVPAGNTSYAMAA